MSEEDIHSIIVREGHEVEGWVKGIGIEGDRGVSEEDKHSIIVRVGHEVEG